MSSNEINLSVPIAAPSNTTVTNNSDINSNSNDNTGDRTEINLQLADIDVSNNAFWYQVKWINMNNRQVPILTQNANGPCPLIALANILFILGKIKLKANLEIISSEALLQALVDKMFENMPQNLTPGEKLNYEQNVQDAIAILPKLQTGLDVNVRFTKVNGYEFTNEIVVFDLFGVNLLHGWLIDPNHKEQLAAIGDCTYNQLVDKIITDKCSEDPQKVNTALIAESFLNSSANQLTYHGLVELHRVVKDQELFVFFRNNHFSTVYKKSTMLFSLVTDFGFLNESNFVWEVLDDVDGDSQFCDANLNLITTSAHQERAIKQSKDKPENTNELPQPAYTSSDSTQHNNNNTEYDRTLYNTDEYLAISLMQEDQIKLDEDLALKLYYEDMDTASTSGPSHTQSQQPAIHPSTPVIIEGETDVIDNNHRTHHHIPGTIHNNTRSSTEHEESCCIL